MFSLFKSPKLTKVFPKKKYRIIHEVPLLLLKQQSGLGECPICMEDLEECVQLHCGHYYHVDCINEWLLTICPSASCPTCRKVIE